MSALIEKLANELADDVMAHVDKTGDEDAISVISKSLGDTSQTLQEAFISSIRVRRAAARAADLLSQRATGSPPKKAAKPKKAAPPVEAPEEASETVEEVEAEAEIDGADVEAPEEEVAAEAEDEAVEEDAEPAPTPDPTFTVKPRRPKKEKVKEPMGPWDLPDFDG